MIQTPIDIPQQATSATVEITKEGFFIEGDEPFILGVLLVLSIVIITLAFIKWKK